MKYDITYSCGHDGTVDLWGKGAERERKISFFERCGLCPECYKAPPKCWGKLFTESALTDEIQKAKSLGAQIKGAKADGCEITSLGQLGGDAVADQLKAEYEEKQSMISSLQKPDRPSILQGKDWNGKIYRDVIYLDGEKTVISAEDKKALEDYLKSMEQYRSEKKKILERNDHE
mgnify:CR=1 FL=1|nr:MAG TPA: pepsin inhibitor [Caudoviricetes sp.]